MTEDLHWSLVENTLITVHGRGPTRKETFEDFISWVGVHRSAIQRALVYSYGGRFSATQRTVFDQKTAHKIGLRVAIVSSDFALRAAGTAASLLAGGKREFKFFPPERLDEALDYIAVPPKERMVVRTRIAFATQKVGCHED